MKQFMALFFIQVTSCKTCPSVLRNLLKKKKSIPDLITVFLPPAPVLSLRDILWMYGKASLLPYSIL